MLINLVYNKEDIRAMSDLFLLSQKELEECSSIIENDFSEFDFDQESQKVTVRTPKGVLLVNWHGVAREIWLSSGVTGAHHFFWDGERWKNTRTGIEFKDQIRKELDILK